MSDLDKLTNKLCPDGVEKMPLWRVTIWDGAEMAQDRESLCNPFQQSVQVYDLVMKFNEKERRYEI